ncbi:hypothetical protein AEA42_20785, partial [Shewanella sp. Sh95]
TDRPPAARPGQARGEAGHVHRVHPARVVDPPLDRDPADQQGVGPPPLLPPPRAQRRHARRDRPDLARAPPPTPPPPHPATRTRRRGAAGPPTRPAGRPQPEHRTARPRARAAGGLAPPGGVGHRAPPERRS